MNAAAGWAAPVTGTAARATSAAGGERGRRWIVRLTIFVIVLLIVEGALRKWALPTQGPLLFFLRDPFVVLVYAIALLSGWWPKDRALLHAGVAFGAFGVLLAGMQLMSGATAAGTQAMLAVYGWRNYFLYVPLLFVIGATFRREDLAFVAKLLLVLAIPIAALVTAQFFAPLGAPINVGIADDAAFQYRGLGLIGGRTRPMGPFTSDVGQREFTVVVMAFVIAAWLGSRTDRLVPRWLLLVATAAALLCLGVGASRGAMVHVALLAGAAMASAVLLGASAATLRALFLVPAVGVAAYFLYPIVVPAAHEAFTSRWDMAAAIEGQHFSFGIVGRALYGLVDFVNLAGQAPLLGYGIGFGGNARLLLGIEIEGFEGWAESDWARHIIDLGPLVGPLYMLFRIVLAGWLVALALRTLRRHRDPLALMLAVYASVQIFQGQLTGHGSVHGFSWVFGGLALAAATCRDAAPPNESGAHDLAAAPPPLYPNLLR